MNKETKSLFCIFFLMFLQSVQLNFAAVVPDQIVEVGLPVGLHCELTNSNNGECAQVLTVGISGTLVQIDIMVNTSFNPTGNLLFDVRPIVDGIPVEDDTLALASLSIPAISIPQGSVWQFVGVDLSSFAIPVEVGDELAIVLRADGGVYRWAGKSRGGYDGGALYFRNDEFLPRMWRIAGDGSDDLGFRTFVDTSPGVLTAVNDSYTVVKDSGTTTLTPAVTSNDEFGDAGPSTMDIVIASAPGHGTATVNDAGTTGNPIDDTINYTPDSDFSGIDSFTYTIENSTGEISTATVEIAVSTSPITIAVASSLDDAEERSTGSMKLTSSDLELTQESTIQTVGMLFRNVFVPPKATITSAYVQFKTDEVNSGPTELVITGEAVDSSQPFTS